MKSSMIIELLALVEYFAANCAEVLGNLSGSFWPWVIVSKRFLVLFPFMPLQALLRRECGVADPARIWAARSLDGDLTPTIKPPCRRRLSFRYSFWGIRLFRNARFVPPHFLTTNIRARFVPPFWKYCFFEACWGVRRATVPGMASVASRMLRRPFDGGWSGYRPRAALTLLLIWVLTYHFTHLRR